MQLDLSLGDVIVYFEFALELVTNLKGDEDGVGGELQMRHFRMGGRHLRLGQWRCIKDD